MTKKLLLLAAAAGLALPAMAAYELNYPADTKITKTFSPSRSLNAVLLGEQSATVGQGSDKLLYHDLTASAVFTAEPGAVVKPSMDWTGKWMNGYLYIDLDGNGEFETTELVSATYYKGHDSTGNSAPDSGGAKDLPAFVVPALKAGDYRMRYVVDWDSLDPKGSTVEGNDIVSNGGAIADVTLRIEADAPEAKGNYETNYPADAQITHSGNPARRLLGLTLSSATTGSQDIAVGQDQDLLLYHDCTNQELLALHGEPLTLAMNWTSDRWMNTYFYIDRDGNGIFDNQIAPSGKACGGSELIAFSNYNKVNSKGTANDDGNVVPLPAFYLPDNLPVGTYRCRFKLDWNNIDPKGSVADPDASANGILADGGAIVDFNLTVVAEVSQTAVRLEPLNCLVMTAAGQPVRETCMSGTDLALKVSPVVPGFWGDKIIVRHGDGENVEDTEIEINADGTVTIPGSLIDCAKITVFALFDEMDDSEWTKVWGDEFNDGKMDSKRWKYHPNWGSTWNRYVPAGAPQQKMVNIFEDGYYNAHCIPTPEDIRADKDNIDHDKKMISGAIYSQGNFTFHYGRVEARIKTGPHSGNFPAFWMMPATNAEGGWPLSGEIDIWEQINTSNQAHSTIHSGWTTKQYGAPGKNSPTSTHAYNADMNEWHVYAAEWDENELRFYVDGVHHFTYTNQHYSNGQYTENVCWPFYKDFYIILNQSVGNGSWAANPDFTHSYKTLFDYVRVYKKKGDNYMTRTIKDNGDDPNFYAPYVPGEDPGVDPGVDPVDPGVDPVDPGVDPVDPGTDPDDPNQSSISSVDADAASVTYFDMNGRRIARPAAGGVYIRKSGNSISKVIL